MLTARQKVLAHLKKTRAASAREIARALKMSAPNVRHHLGILTSDGRLEVTSVHQRGGRGRPEKCIRCRNLRWEITCPFWQMRC